MFRASNSVPSVASDEFNMHRVILLVALLLFNFCLVAILVAAASHRVCNVGKFESRDIVDESFIFVL